MRMFKGVAVAAVAACLGSVAASADEGFYFRSKPASIGGASPTAGTENPVGGPAVSGSPVAEAEVGTATSFAFSASGGAAPYAWTASGLPSGLSVGQDGVVSGTPTQAGTVGDAKVTVTDAGGRTASSQTFSITVIGPLSVTGEAPATAKVGMPVSFALAASGGKAPYAFSATGLPDGLSISTQGVVSGTPSSPGTFPAVRVTAVDARGISANHPDFAIEVADFPAAADVAAPTVTSDGTPTLVGSTLRGMLHDGSNAATETLQLSTGQSVEFSYSETVKVRSVTASATSASGAVLALDVFTGATWSRIGTGTAAATSSSVFQASFPQAVGDRFRIVAISGIAQLAEARLDGVAALPRPAFTAPTTLTYTLAGGQSAQAEMSASVSGGSVSSFGVTRSGTRAAPSWVTVSGSTLTMAPPSTPSADVSFDILAMGANGTYAARAITVVPAILPALTTPAQTWVREDGRGTVTGSSLAAALEDSDASTFLQGTGTSGLYPRATWSSAVRLSSTVKLTMRWVAPTSGTASVDLRLYRWPTGGGNNETLVVRSQNVAKSTSGSFTVVIPTSNWIGTSFGMQIYAGSGVAFRLEKVEW